MVIVMVRLALWDIAFDEPEAVAAVTVTVVVPAGVSTFVPHPVKVLVIASAVPTMKIQSDGGNIPRFLLRRRHRATAAMPQQLSETGFAIVAV